MKFKNGKRKVESSSGCWIDYFILSFVNQQRSKRIYDINKARVCIKVATESH